jgi:uncharacterized repeat protein (TIGR01451 family)
VITGTVNITNNHIFSNGIGIRFADTGAGTATGNTIETNGTGVLVENGGTATLTCNNIAGNSTYGVNNTTGVTIDAEGNWWGSASGPTHPSNPTGAGDVVSDNVDFTPWTLAATPDGCGSLSSASVAGYFYLAATGEIVSGGSVAVASPAVVASSGVSGAYQWLTGGTAGIYAMSVTPPVGYALSTGCPAQVGPYTPTGVNPIFLGASEVGNTGVLSNNTCAANPYYLRFALGVSPFVYNNNLPLQGTGAIAGLVWNDIVADSVQTPPEPPLANVEVQVYGAGLDNTLRTMDDLVYTATTNASGGYTVANLAPDQYLIRLESLSLPVGFEPRNGYEITVTLGAGQVLPNENFPLGYLGKAQIGNYVWDDLDGDGDLAGDPGEGEFVAGLDGVTLSLYLNPDNSGTFDPNTDLLLAVTTTGDDPTTGAVTETGWYRLLAAADGALTFWVVVDASNFLPGGALEGYVQTFPVLSNNTRAVVGLGLPGTDNDVDFAYVSTQGQIGDLVWYDTNGDGVRDPGEPGIPGVGLSLDLPGGGISNTTTSASGLYTFGNLLPGVYTVTVGSGLPPGAVNTLGPDGKLSPYTLTLLSGQAVTTANFGYDVATGYTVTKTLDTVPPVLPGDELTFTVRITNTGSSWLTALTLSDLYDRRVLRFERATPPPNDPTDDGQLDWSNLLAASLAPGQGVAVVIAFTAIRDPGAQYNNDAVNTAVVSGVQADPDGNGPLGSVESAPDSSASARVKILSPTAADLANLAVAEQGDGSVLLSWETTNEANLAGFHVLRQAAGAAPVRLTGQLLIAQNSGQPAGASYNFRDIGAVPGTAYLYILQVQRLDGAVEELVLGEVGTGAGIQLFLPAVAR